MLMSSFSRPSAARSQPNTTREFFRVSVAAVLLLLSSFSSRDVEALADFTHTNAGLDFDHKFHSAPLVAVPENGSRSESIVKQQAELVHCTMLVNRTFYPITTCLTTTKFTKPPRNALQLLAFRKLGWITCVVGGHRVSTVIK
jgi:hypothetical protein